MKDKMAMPALTAKEKLVKQLKRTFRVVISICLVWYILHTILNDRMVPGESNLFSLGLLYVCGMALSFLFDKITLSPIAAVFIAGVILRNIQTSSGDALGGMDPVWTGHIRRACTCLIYTRSGFGVNLKNVRNSKFVVVFLTIMPAVVEAVVTAGIAVGFFEFSYLWGVMLGFGLSDLAKAISVPVLCDCAQKKLSTHVGLPDIGLAAGPPNGVFSLLAFYAISRYVPELKDPSEDATFRALHPLIEILGGTFFGIVCAYALYVVTLNTKPFVRQALVSRLAYVGQQHKMFAGGIMAAFLVGVVLSNMWDKQTKKPVEDWLRGLWLWAGQLYLFGLTGTSLDFRKINNNALWQGLIIIFAGIFIRFLFTTVTLKYLLSKWTWKESAFIGVIWISKAAVQATLSSVALEELRERFPTPTNRSTVQYAIAEEWAISVQTVLNISIILTTPLSAIILRKVQPYWLRRAPDDEPTSPVNTAAEPVPTLSVEVEQKRAESGSAVPRVDAQNTDENLLGWSLSEFRSTVPADSPSDTPAEGMIVSAV